MNRFVKKIMVNKTAAEGWEQMKKLWQVQKSQKKSRWSRRKFDDEVIESLETFTLSDKEVWLKTLIWK